MKRLTIIGLWPDDVVKYCTEKCDCRRYAFDRILYHRGGRDARERICIPVVDRSGAVTTYLDLPVLFLEANAVYLHLDDGSDIFLSNTQMLLIANEVERLRAGGGKDRPQRAAAGGHGSFHGRQESPPEKPVSWLPPVGTKGLMFLRCPKCKDEFVQFLREPQTVHECRKCGAKIPLDALARFEYTCPDCKKTSYGRTNIEDAEITNQKFSCVCGRSIPKLTWDPVKHCYTM